MTGLGVFFSRRAPPTMSSRQRCVTGLTALGRTLGEIAAELPCSRSLVSLKKQKL